jgi:hypothetical protein
MSPTKKRTNFLHHFRFFQHTMVLMAQASIVAIGVAAPKLRALISSMAIGDAPCAWFGGIIWGEQVVSAWRHDAFLRHCLRLRRHRGRRSSMSHPVHPVGPPMNCVQQHLWATDDASGPTRQRRATAPCHRRRPLLQMSTTMASPIGRHVIATARRHAA